MLEQKSLVITIMFCYIGVSHCRLLTRSNAKKADIQTLLEGTS